LFLTLVIILLLLHSLGGLDEHGYTVGVALFDGLLKDFASVFRLNALFTVIFSLQFYVLHIVELSILLSDRLLLLT